MLFRLKAVPVAQRGQGLPEERPHREADDRDIRDFADIRHRAGRTRVRLDDIDRVVLDDELDVQKSLHLQRHRELSGVVDDGVLHLWGQALRRIDRNTVARVDARPLDVLHDAGDHGVDSVTDGVDLDLGAHQVLVDQDRVFLRDRVDDADLLADVFVAVRDVHALPAEDVRRAHQDRVAQLVGRGDRLLTGVHHPAGRARDMVLRQDRVEALAVLRLVDAVERGSEQRHAHLFDRPGQLDRRLAAELHDRAVGLFQLDDMAHILRGERLEIKFVRNVEIGAHRFRVVVHDDRLVPQLFQRPHAVDGAEVELDPLPDADRAGADDEDLLPVGKRDGLVLCAVGGIVIGGLRVELGGAGIDHFIHGVNVPLVFQRADPFGADPGKLRDGLVEEAEFLCPVKQLLRHRLFGKALLHRDDGAELAQEPAVDLGDAVQLFHREAAAQRLGNREHAAVVHRVDALRNVVVGKAVQLFVRQVVHVLFQAADRLHQRRLEGAGDAHDLAGRLHLGAQAAARVDELVERPFRDLHHAVIEGRLKASICFPGNGVFDLVQRIAERDFGSDLRDRVAGRLRGKRRGTADAGVHLDHAVLEAVRIQRELHVAAALHLQLRDDGERRGAQHLDLFVRQGLTGRHDDGIARVDADRVEVFHIADGDAVAVPVAHHLVFDFLPAGDAALDQHLPHAAAVQPHRRNCPKLFLAVRDAAAAAAQRIGGAHHHGVADPLRDLQAVLYGPGRLAFRAGLMDAGHSLFEQLPVLGHADGVGLRADHLDAVLLQKAGFLQLHRKVQGVLPAERRQDAVRGFLQDHLFHGVRRQRLDVDLVGDLTVRHDGGGVRVDEDHLDPLFLQRAAGLGAGVVELGGLSDHDRAGADDDDPFDVFAFAHIRLPPIRSMNLSNRKPVSCGPAQASGWNWTEKTFPLL